MSKSSWRGTTVFVPAMYGTPTRTIRSGGTVWKLTSAGPKGPPGPAGPGFSQSLQGNVDLTPSMSRWSSCRCSLPALSHCCGSSKFRLAASDERTAMNELEESIVMLFIDGTATGPPGAEPSWRLAVSVPETAVTRVAPLTCRYTRTNVRLKEFAVAAMSGTVVDGALNGLRHFETEHPEARCRRQGGVSDLLPARSAGAEAIRRRDGELVQPRGQQPVEPDRAEVSTDWLNQ